MISIIRALNFSYFITNIFFQRFACLHTYNNAPKHPIEQVCKVWEPTFARKASPPGGLISMQCGRVSDKIETALDKITV